MNRALLTFVMVWACAPLPAQAHPSHVAIAEVEWNRETGNLEVAMRLRPEDVEDALSRMLRSERVDLERTKDVDKHLAAYLTPHFTVAANDQRQTIQWVGKEVTLRFVWVYFEVPMPENAATADLTLSCTVLMDLLPDQTNTVLLRDGNARWSKQFTRHKPRQAWK